MTTICMFCHVVKSGDGDPISHGICYPCRELIYGVPSVPALMAPATTRWECRGCKYASYDHDGVAEGCDVDKCIRTDRRSPWALVELHNRLLKRISALQEAEAPASIRRGLEALYGQAWANEHAGRIGC